MQIISGLGVLDIAESFTSCLLLLRSLFKMKGVVPFSLALVREDGEVGEGGGGVEQRSSTLSVVSAVSGGREGGNLMMAGNVYTS